MTKVNSHISNVKRNVHSLMCTNSTTGNFKDVQPLFCRLMMPNSSIDLNLSSFVRLAPLVFPTFGRVTSRFLAKYVPFEQIFPQTSTFLSGLPVNTRNFSGVYNSVPQISNYCLWQILTNYSALNDGFSVAQTWSNMTNSEMDSSVNVSDMRCMPLEEYFMRFESDVKEYIETGVISDKMFIVNDSYDDDGNVISSHPHHDSYLLAAAVDHIKNGISLEDCATKYGVSFRVANAQSVSDFQAAYNSADYVDVYTAQSSALSSTTTYRLTERGRMLRKIFIGLGYQPSKNNTTKMSVLPILAFYKAYFDAFYPKRLANFADTWCYKFIDTCTLISQCTEADYLYHGNNYPSTSTVKPYPDATSVEQTNYRSAVNNFTEFVKNELSLCYSTHDQDFFTLQTSDINGNAAMQFETDRNVSTNSISVITQGDDIVLKQGRKSNNSVVPLSTTSGTANVAMSNYPTNAWTLKLLQRLQNMANRNSLIGRNVERFVRSHFNSDVYNELYLSSRSVASSSFDVSISDIDSTAQTSQTQTIDGSTTTIGDNLGAYAGKGVGNGGLSANFKADTFGYLIILQWFEVESGYYFGTDPQLHYCSRLDMPNSEFDALGYEITPRSCMWTDNNISYNVASPSYTDSMSISDDSGFGFIPRMSRFKTSHNVVNGDFSRHSLQASLSPFYLDRKPVVRYLDFTRVDSTSKAQTVMRKLPLASAEWQYNSRYDWLSDFNRIFYQSGNLFGKQKATSIGDSDYLIYGLDDNLLLHNVIRWKEVNSLRPLSESYDTEVGDNNAPTEITPA